MTPKLQILSTVYTRISNHAESCYGGLYGIMYDKTLLIVGYCTDWDLKENKDLFLKLQVHYPTGIDFCGVISFKSNSPVSDTELIEYIKDVSVTDNPILLKVNPGLNEPISTFFYCNNRFAETCFKVMPEEEFHDLFVWMRLETSVPITAEITPSSISEALEELQKVVSSGAFVFHVVGSKTYLQNSEAYNYVHQRQTVGKLTENKSVIDNSYVCSSLNWIIFKIETLISTAVQESQVPPIICTKYSNSKKLKADLPIDALCVAPKSRILQDSYGLFIDALSRALRLFEHHLCGNWSDLRKVAELRQYHFKPSPLGHFITVLYSCLAEEDFYLDLREKYHKYFDLALNFPFLRKGNAMEFQEEELEYLKNVHEGLKPSGVEEGTLAVVRGSYGYYHYMMGLDDNGWGCAYRSLQTVFSWFKLQGYTAKPIPSHRDIQKCLVDIQDKPRDFLGSKQWIGSMEVSFCLDTMLGITCRTLNVPSGGQMNEIGAELLSHFEVHGTPVMIGGGTLAHTILGVHYNQNTGAIKYLVLDPHYTGENKLRTIQSKGWVGWKSNDFWNKKSYYNLCMPFRPSCI